MIGLLFFIAVAILATIVILLWPCKESKCDQCLLNYEDCKIVISWLACDSTGDIYLYFGRPPVRDNVHKVWLPKEGSGYEVADKLAEYVDITWEDEPLEVSLNIRI